VLYIPRGVMHAAATTDTLSIHITLGVLSYTWADLLVDAVRDLVEHAPAWRESVPVGFARRDEAPAELRDGLASRLATFAQSVDLAAVIDARRRTLESHLRPRVRDHLQQVLEAEALAPHDVVQWRAGLPSQIERRGERVALLCGAREVELPATADVTLELLRGGEALVAGDVPDALDWTSRRVVLIALIREGWLVRHAEPDAAR
jgi:hypothetical protein